MRYLKPYQIFEASSEEVIRYLYDIFLESEHEGFNTLVEKLTSLYNWDNVYTVLIFKGGVPLAYSPKKSHRFKMKDVLETILTAESYMKSLGYKISLIETRELKELNGRTDVVEYDSSVLKSGRREQSRETFTLKIEFVKE
jgi:hypothetical protein